MRVSWILMPGYLAVPTAMGSARTTIEETVGKWPAQTLVEENEDHGDLHALVGESIGVSGAVAFEQCVGAQLA